MITSDEILDWLSQAEPNPNNLDCLLHREEETKLFNQRHPLSPPESESYSRRRRPMSESPPPTPKRRRLEESTGGVDNGDVQDETPRANSSWTGLPGGVPEASASPTKRQNRRRAHRTHTASPIPSLSSQSESQSYTSGRSSPTKRLATLELNHDGIETRVMSLTNPLLPETLAEILSELEFCSNGLGVVSRSCKDEIQAQAQANRSFSLFRDFMYADPETRDTLGPTPSVPDVMWILEEARECQDTMQSESGWNMGVHFPLLHKAIYGQRRQKQLVGVAACTTAKIIKEYLPCDSPAKMVDFSIYLAPDAGPLTNETKAAVDAISSLRRVLPCGVINHTDFFPLRSRSMVVSIETKKRGGAQQEAELQIGTWHTAQWKFLSRLVSDAGGTFDGLPFLPGIVVQGHEWSFVATTREGPKTILWLEQGFGSTTTALGVYKIVWGLQRIARWAEDVYWPWFKKNALGV